MNQTCPCCKKKVGRNHFACVANAIGGRVKSKAKARAARRNGKKGGRPKKNPEPPTN